jgi:transposase-like protein
MVISVCDHSGYEKNGKTKAGAARFRCKLCGKSWTAFTEAFEGMRVGMDLAVQIITLLIEGNSVSGTARATGTDPHTVTKRVALGKVCIFEWKPSITFLTSWVILPTFVVSSELLFI